jgi:LDH2 family malate/lactate/ureidoglycolate dehydrogenase
VPEILLPGELEHREEGRARKLGLELDGVIWKELADLAGELGVSRELERARR